jgi:hypothetical protein
VSGDTAPQSGPGLEAPVRPDGAAKSHLGHRKTPVEPSLVRVVGTTARLWVRRRILRVADGSSVGPLRWTALSVAVLVVVGGIAAGAAAGLRTRGATSPPPRHVTAAKPDPARAELTANEQAAASWIAAQVSPAAAVECDTEMCGDLAGAGFTTAQQLALSAGATLPPGALIVVSTPLLRGALGSQIGARTPAVAASFGSGAQLVQVRVGGTRSAAAYQSALRHEVSASGRAGRSLTGSPRLHLYGNSQAEIISGRVDPRLLVLLRRLITQYPVYVTAFGDAGPGASWPATLRAVSIEASFGTGKKRVTETAGLERLARRQKAPYRAGVRVLQAAAGRVIVILTFPVVS